MYKLEFSKQSIKDLKSITTNYIKRINEKLKILVKNPYDSNLNVKKLKGFDHTYRLRVGEYRIVYEMIEGKLVIQIIRIKTRGNIYG